MLPAPIQIAAHVGHEFGPVARPALAESAGLDVRIQPFIGDQFLAVARHPNQPQTRRVGVCNARGFPGFVRRMPIHDQLDLSGDLFE